LKQLFHKELSNPSPEFVKHFAKQVYPSNISTKILDLFTNLTKKSIQQYISDLITERLKVALTKEDETTKAQETANREISKVDLSKVVTTEEELEGFMIVKSILRQKVELSRITQRDAQSYFAILLDDNNRKPICRLYLGNKKHIGVFDEQKKEIKSEILSLDEIYKYADQLLKTTEGYMNAKE